MRTLIWLTVIFLYSNLTLADGGLDPICKNLGTKWGILKNPTGVQETINKLQAVRSPVDLKVNKQIAIWKKLDGVTTCLKTHAGMSFLTKKVFNAETGKYELNDYLYITDIKKMETFRLAQNHIQCHIGDPKFIPPPLNRDLDNTRVVTMYSGMKEKEKYEQAKKEHQKEIEKSQQLRNDIQINNSFGDVGLENYCSHHLQMYQLQQKSYELRDRRRACEKHKDEGTLVVEGPDGTKKVRGGCADFPDKIGKDMKTLASEMDKVYKETGYQPYDLMSDFDKSLYSSFQGDIAKLKEAQKLAEKSLKWSYDAEKYLSNNGLWYYEDSLNFCGEEDKVLDNQFLAGQNQCEEYLPILNFKTTEFSTNIDAVKTLHRNDLVKELNAQAFTKNAESGFHLLESGSVADQLLHKNLLADFKNKEETNYMAACLTMAGPGICQDKIYYAQFKKGINNAITTSQMQSEDHAPAGAFLHFKNETVASDINRIISKMQKMCDDRNSQLLTFDLDVMAKAIEDYQQELRNLQKYAGYFYDENVKEKSHIDQWTKEGLKCPMGSSFLDSELTAEDIAEAKAGFREANHNQMQLRCDFQKPDRGGHSNFVGEWACGKYGKEKEDLYALSSLLTSHPYMAGQMVSSVDQNLTRKEKTKTGIDKSEYEIEKKMYMSLLCEAKNCSLDVHEFNQSALEAVKTGAMMASFLPIPGLQFVTAGIYAAADIGQKVEKNFEASEKAELMKGGIISGGFTPGYDADVADRLKQMEEEGSAGNLAFGIAETILIEAGSMIGAKYLMKGLEAAIKPALKSKLPGTELVKALAPWLDEVKNLEKHAANEVERAYYQKVLHHFQEHGSHHIVENTIEKKIHAKIHHATAGHGEGHGTEDGKGEGGHH